MTKIVTIVQARTKSTRLPGKVLLSLCGQPLLLRMIERVERASLKGSVVVATTTDAADNAVYDLCLSKNIHVFRGSEDDLLDRHYQCAKKHHADVVLKVPSDCPLICPTIIDRVIGFFLNYIDQFDYVSNLHPETYPYGNDVEVMTFDTLETAWKYANRKHQREHTTPYIWETPDQFRIGNVVWEGGQNYSTAQRWTIDYPEDYQFIKTVFESLYPENPGFTFNDILAFLAHRPEVVAMNAKYHGTSWYTTHLNETKNIHSISQYQS